MARRKTKMYKNVVAILSDNTPSKRTGTSPRDSDAELYIQILQRVYGAGLSDEQMDLIRSVKFESMSRVRRKLQENGEYLPSVHVIKMRGLKSMIIEQTAPKETPVGLAARLEEPVR